MTNLKIIGADDWLVFARRDDGALVFTVVEADPAWLNMPHRGETDFGTAEWRVNWACMLGHVQATWPERDWQECGTDTDGTPLAWPASDDAKFAYLAPVRPIEWKRKRY